jgi:hypothetical protein
VVNPLAEGLPFFYIKKSMLEKIHIDITQVGRHLPFQDVREFISERNHTCVMNVATPISLAHPFAIIREFAVERNLLNAVNVGEPSVRVHHSFNMKESTLEKSPTGVISVVKASLLFLDSIDIE